MKKVLVSPLFERGDHKGVFLYSPPFTVPQCSGIAAEGRIPDAVDKVLS